MYWVYPKNQVLPKSSLRLGRAGQTSESICSRMSSIICSPSDSSHSESSKLARQSGKLALVHP